MNERIIKPIPTKKCSNSFKIEFLIEHCISESNYKHEVKRSRSHLSYTINVNDDDSENNSPNIFGNPGKKLKRSKYIQL